MSKIRVPVIVLLLVVLAGSSGCESFRKKFVRKKKRQPAEEEMVISPVDYSKQQLPGDQAYQQYYVYWKSWHGELLAQLQNNANKKKILGCFEQMILNLDRMKNLLANEKKSAQLQTYIDEIQQNYDEVENKNFLIVSFAQLKESVESLSRAIHREFAFSKIKDDLR